ncbi:MAG TPA: hypothetical protein VK886_10545 [Vicinamibacterales bacterium]|nr:hypothetical protein [Vicinamibacterales bacterium]
MTGRMRVIAVAAIVTIAPAFSACAYAQYGGHRDGRYGRVMSPAFDVGYREGFEHGVDDARRGRDFAFAHSRDYQRADRGWNGRYGSRDAYRYEFRRGYEQGYREAYGRNSRYRRNVPYGGVYRDGPRGTYPSYPGGAYPSNPGAAYPNGRYGYRSPAAEYGYNEGLEKGREDARDGDRYDPVRHKWYRDGDRHYNGRYGSREQWKAEYREAFRQGYDQGYRR